MVSLGVKYKKNDKNIEITVDENDIYYYINIHDSGDKIKDEIAEKIFDRYFTTKKEDRGTGLGLNFCFNSLNFLLLPIV